MSAPALRTAALALALGGLGCGPDLQGAPLPLDLTVSAAIAPQLRELQISLLPASLPGGRVDCDLVRTTCASTLDRGHFLKLRDAAGKEVLAVRFPVALSGAPAAQEVRVTGIPVGRDYAVLVEGLSDTQLLASACGYVSEIRPGARNPPFTATLLALNPPPRCDPRF